MLELPELTTVKLNNVQTRMEHHGDDQVLAIDLSITWNTNNRALTAIDDQLRQMLFCDLRQEADGDQAEMELPVDELPNVRVPGIKYPLVLPDFQQVGARVEIAYGISEASAIVLQLCKVSKVKVTPVEGGSVGIKYSISSSADIDVHSIAPLFGLQQHEISLKLTMPDVEQPTERLTPDDVFPADDAEAGASKAAPKLTKAQRQAAAKSATEQFLGQHAGASE